MGAPVDGTIGKIFETNHAFSIESDSGVELFVHFGIDTVELKGEGFKRIAEEGQRVKVGDTVIEFDLPLLESQVNPDSGCYLQHGRNQRTDQTVR